MIWDNCWKFPPGWSCYINTASTLREHLMYCIQVLIVLPWQFPGESRITKGNKQQREMLTVVGDQVCICGFVLMFAYSIHIQMWGLLDYDIWNLLVLREVQKWSGWAHSLDEYSLCYGGPSEFLHLVKEEAIDYINLHTRVAWRIGMLGDGHKHCFALYIFLNCSALYVILSIQYGQKSIIN